MQKSLIIFDASSIRVGLDLFCCYNLCKIKLDDNKKDDSSYYDTSKRCVHKKFKKTIVFLIFTHFIFDKKDVFNLCYIEMTTKKTILLILIHSKIYEKYAYIKN